MLLSYLQNYSADSFVLRHAKAVGWELMKEVSGWHDWGMNVVVNICGKTADALDFRGSGICGDLFGNGITAAMAQTSTMTDDPPNECNFG
jgi:hypothetical protein